jgi:hypothetical protein
VTANSAVSFRLKTIILHVSYKLVFPFELVVTTTETTLKSSHLLAFLKMIKGVIVSESRRAYKASKIKLGEVVLMMAVYSPKLSFFSLFAVRTGSIRRCFEPLIYATPAVHRVTVFVSALFGLPNNFVANQANKLRAKALLLLTALIWI